MRDQAARLVAQLCARFSDAYYNMQPRISRTLLKALLDKSKPLTTHYGAPRTPYTPNRAVGALPRELSVLKGYG